MDHFFECFSINDMKMSDSLTTAINLEFGVRANLLIELKESCLSYLYFDDTFEEISEKVNFSMIPS